MGIFRSKTIPLLAIIFPLFANGVQAATLEPWQANGYFTVQWGAIPIGKVAVKAQENKEQFYLTSEITTDGMAAVVKKADLSASAHGRHEEGNFRAGSYDYQANRQPEPRRIALSYAPDGTLASRYLSPPDDPAKRPRVETEQTAGSVDPITAFYRVRQRLRDGATEVTERIFDGRRLYEVTARPKDSRMITLNQRQIKVLAIGLTRKPLAGFKKKELDKYAAGDAKVTVFVSDDAVLAPVAFHVELRLGSLQGMWIAN